jgi:hypothetical protein
MSKEFRKPDLNAPRFRQKAHSIGSRKFYNSFRRKFPKHKDLTNVQISAIIKSFNEAFWETVIENRDGVQFPEGLGAIFVGTCQRAKSANVDYAKSNKYGVTVSNTNWETDGKLAKIFYTSFASKYKYAFRECWSFSACRNFKRAVAKSYPENWNMYIQVDSNRKLWKVYTAITIRDVKKKKLDTKLENYNEFDL